MAEKLCYNGGFLPGPLDFYLIPFLPMTKSDLIDAIAEKANLQHTTAEAAICLLFDLMSDSLKKGERIEIRGFGTFQNRKYAAYSGRNPKTGKVVSVAPKVLPFFKVGKKLKEIVNVETKK